MSPWGWECKARLVKQVKTNPTQKRTTRWDDFVPPGPAHYPPPEIFCGRGFSKIKQAPAYSFGLYTPVRYTKPAAKPNAPSFNISGMTRKGIPKVPQGIISKKVEVPGDKTIKPGPGAHSPKYKAYLKNPPKYTMRIAAKPPYEPWDMWTPSPIMYCPPIPGKKQPAYSFGDRFKPCYDKSDIPAPFDHRPKFDLTQKSKLAFSFGQQTQICTPYNKIPAPNEYCEKRFMYSKKCNPASSFGIHHSPYLGKATAYEKPSRLELLAVDLP